MWKLQGVARVTSEWAGYTHYNPTPCNKTQLELKAALEYK